jgi:hypothetical protein
MIDRYGAFLSHIPSVFEKQEIPAELDFSQRALLTRAMAVYAVLKGQVSCMFNYSLYRYIRSKQYPLPQSSI